MERTMDPREFERVAISEHQTGIVEDRIAIDKPAAQFHLVERVAGEYQTLCPTAIATVYDREKADTDGMRCCPACDFERGQRGGGQ